MLDEEDILCCVMFFYICVLYTQITMDSNLRDRRWCVRPMNRDRKSAGYFVKTFLPMKQDSQQFFKLLLTLVKDSLEKTSVREPICPEERLSLTLLHLAHGVPHQAIAWSYKLGKTTVRNIILETCDVLWKILHPIYVSEPSASQYKDIAMNFLEKWNMPNCVGAIDGKHIAIKCPRNAGSNFFNYKKYHSIVLLATCDGNYTFTSVSVGSFGGQSEGGIFQTTPFGRALMDGKLPLPANAPLAEGRQPFPYFFVGDAAFPLRGNLMRPYPGAALNRRRRIFNYRLSRARRVIENAFGILVARWRIFKQTIDAEPRQCEKIVLATVALHNFIMLNDQKRWYCPQTYVDWEGTNNLLHEGDWRVEAEDQDSALRSSRSFIRNASRLAFKQRDELAEFFETDGAVEFHKKIVDLLYGKE